MWHYEKQYLPYAVLAALFMVGEVLMDLVQPGLMSRIVDEGVLGIDNNGVGDPYLILTLGLTMVVLVMRLLEQCVCASSQPEYRQ